MGSAMFAEGAGTRLTATTVSVTNNKLLEAYNLKTSRNLNVLVATDGAIATLNSVTVTDNTGVDVSVFYSKYFYCLLCTKIHIFRSNWTNTPLFYFPGRPQRGFSANSGAQVSVIDATFSNNVGTSPPDLLSNVVMSEDGGSMNVLRLQASNLEAFSVSALSLILIVDQYWCMGITARHANISSFMHAPRHRLYILLLAEVPFRS